MLTYPFNHFEHKLVTFGSNNNYFLTGKCILNYHWQNVGHFIPAKLVNYFPLVPHICVNESTRVSIGSDTGLSHAGLLSIGPPNNFQWNFNKNTKFFIHENAFENIVWKWWPFCPGGDKLISVRVIWHPLWRYQSQYRDPTRASRRLKSTTSGLFVQQFLQKEIKYQRSAKLSLREGNQPA